LKQYIQLIQQSKKLQFILILGFFVQVIFCITSVGFFHPDQHFQIIEFSSYQLKQPNAATEVWELAKNIRPTVQVYIFSAFKICCEFVAVNNPFNQLAILRVIQGILFWVVFNAITFYYCKNKSTRTLIIALLLLNFSWFLPYSRTIFSSEMISAIIFFPAIIFYHQRYTLNKTNAYNSIFIGILLAFSFFLRFQIAFAMVGFAAWILLFEKKIKLSFYLLVGFLIGVFINVYLDYIFYEKLVFTPYLYFKINILEGKAASFGEKSFTYYIGVLIGIIGAPVISIILLYHYLKTSIQKFKHPIVLSTLLFIVGHCLVGHKEERFIFTIINMIPIILTLNDNAFSYFSTNFKWKKIIKPIAIFSIGLNCILLLLFFINPYSQTIQFAKKISTYFNNKPIKMYCYLRTPLQTESHLPLTFYANGMQNIEFVNINNIDSITKSTVGSIWLSSTFNDIKGNLHLIDSLGYKPQLYSSSMLWNINLFMLNKNKNTINDIWVLYKIEK
jgi:phosphatidylinositol glycan class B